MDLSPLARIIESLAVGAVGGLVAYWLGRRRFVNERVWEARYKLYGEIFDILHQLEHSLAVLEAVVDCDSDSRTKPEVLTAACSYDQGLLKLNQLQERLLLLGANEAHARLMVVYASLRVLTPAMVTGPNKLEEFEVAELRDAIKWSRREASGRNGELAFLARRELVPQPPSLLAWWNRRQMRKRLSNLMESYQDQTSRSVDNGG